MRLLLDTHALLWSLDGDKRLGPIALKTQAGKLDADTQGISDALGRNGVILLGVSVAHLTALTSLPRHHKDPFDYLLIAQAIAEHATLMSKDRWMPSYPVPVVSCSA